MVLSVLRLFGCQVDGLVGQVSRFDLVLEGHRGHAGKESAETS